jgi:hypothetical protein
MACETFLTIEFEVAFAIIDNNFIIHRLACEVFSIGMHGGSWDSVHVWFRNVFSHHGDAKLPHIYFLVIRGGHEPSSIFNKCESIN